MAWTGSRAIVIDHTKVPSTQTDFPVVLATTFTYLKSVSNGGEVQNQPYDIIFASDALGAFPLAFERAYYDPVSGKAEFWVKVPSLSSSVDTTIYILSGNAAVTTEQAAPTSVWAAYAAVYHLGDGTGTTVDGTESTGVNTATTHTNAQVFKGAVGGGAARFKNSPSGYLNAADNASILDLAAGNVTWEFWMRKADFNSSFPSALNKGNWAGSANKGWVIWPTTDPGVPSIELDVLRSYPNTARWAATFPSWTDWVRVMISYNGGYGATDALIYLNGVLATTTNYHAGSGTLGSDSGFALLLGGDPGYGSSAVLGRLDEIRISRVVQTADYAAICYANEFDPSTFFKSGFPPIPSTEFGPAVVQVDTTSYTRQSVAEINPLLLVYGADLYQVGMQTGGTKPNLKTIKVQKSSDKGFTWVTLDIANSPNAATQSGYLWYVIVGDTLSILYKDTSNNIFVQEFNLLTGLFGTLSSALSIGSTFSSWFLTALFYRKTNGDYIIAFNDNANLYLITLISGTWTGPTSLAGMATTMWGGRRDANDVGHFLEDSGPPLNYYQLSASLVLSSPIDTGVGTISHGAKRPSLLLWNNSVVVAAVDTNSIVKVSIGTPLGGPSFTVYSVADYSLVAGSPIISYATPWVDKDGNLNVSWVYIDLTYPVIDRIVTSVFDGVSSWSAPIDFYDVTDRLPREDPEDPRTQFLHTLDVVQFSDGTIVMDTALENQIGFTNRLCTGFVLIALAATLGRRSRIKFIN